VSGWSIPSSGPALGAEVRIAAVPTGETSVSRVDPFLVGRKLRPGGRGSARGSVSVTNVAGIGRALRLRALPSAADLDDLLELSVSAGSKPLYLGALGGLRAWTKRTLTLASGAHARLAVRAWLRSGARHGYAGRIEDVRLELRSEAPR
jgi:hypothetical protein